MYVTSRFTPRSRVLRHALWGLFAIGCGLRSESVLFSKDAAPEAGAPDAPPDGGGAPLEEGSIDAGADAAGSGTVCGTTACAPGYQCTDDPTDTCSPDAGSCPGRCLPAATGKACGGFVGFVCATDEWCDYGPTCPLPDQEGACRKKPTVADCLPAPPATCAHAVCTCDGVNHGCDWCGTYRAGSFVQPCN